MVIRSKAHSFEFILYLGLLFIYDSIRFRLKRLAITKLDVLDQLPELKIAIAYKYNGQVLDSFPGI